VVVVDIDVHSVWMAAVGMVNISRTTFSFVSVNVTNGPCAASQYINPCFSCLYFRACPTMLLFLLLLYLIITKLYVLRSSIVGRLRSVTVEPVRTGSNRLSIFIQINATVTDGMSK
jgi:hypothetical protein